MKHVLYLIKPIPMNSKFTIAGILLTSLLISDLFAFTNIFGKPYKKDSLSVICEWEHKNNLIPLTIRNEQICPLNHISRDYRIPAKCQIPEARKIIVTYAKDLLSAINTSREIRPDLGCYPFTENQLSLYIRLIDEEIGTFAEFPHVAMVVILSGKVFYVGNKNNCTPLFNIAVESFEEACALLEHEAQGE